jgi:hypothetical protein
VPPPPVFRRYGSLDNTQATNFTITRGRFAHIPVAKYDPPLDALFLNFQILTKRGTDSPPSPLVFVVRGRYDPLQSDYGTDKNINGYLSNHNNLNPSPYVQRTRYMCGLAKKQYLATCDHFISCYEDYSTLSDCE